MGKCAKAWASRNSVLHPDEDHICAREGGHPGKCRCECGRQGVPKGDRLSEYRRRIVTLENELMEAKRKPLYQWTDHDGQRWACAAADHGGFCRLCQQVDEGDETLEALIGMVHWGLTEVSADADGRLRFRTTTAGERRISQLAEGDSDLFAALMEAEMGDPEIDDSNP